MVACCPLRPKFLPVADYNAESTGALITDAGSPPLAQDSYGLWTATIAHRKGVTGSPPRHYTLAVIGYPLCQNYELRWETPYPTLLEAAVYIESFLVQITTSLL